LDTDLGALILLRAIDGLAKRRQTVHGRLPTGESNIGIHEPTQRVPHVSKRSRRLHQSTEREGARKETRRGGNERNDRRCLAVACRKPRQLPLTPHDCPPRGEHIAKARTESAQLVLLAAIESHALHVVAEPYQTVAKISLGSLLAEIQGDECLPDQMRHPVTCQRVDNGYPDYIAGNYEAMLTKV